MLIELATLPIEMQQQFLQIKQGEQIIITQKGEIIKTVTINEQSEQLVNSKPSYAKGDFNFDLERIQHSVESGRVEIPKTALTDIDSFDKWLDTVTV